MSFFSDFSSDIIALNIHFSEKNSFESIIFQLTNMKNITYFY